MSFKKIIFKVLDIPTPVNISIKQLRKLEGFQWPVIIFENLQHLLLDFAINAHHFTLIFIFGWFSFMACIYHEKFYRRSSPGNYEEF